MSFHIDAKAFLQSQCTRVDLQDLFFLEKAPCDLLYNNLGHREYLRRKGEKIDKTFFIDSLKKELTCVYIRKGEENEVVDAIFASVTMLGRRIAQESTSNFAKKILHFMTIFQKHLYQRPLSDELINYQTVSFKIWLTFINKHHHSKLREVFQSTFNGPYEHQFIKNIVGATVIYKLIRQEQLFSEPFCQNMAIAGLFSEIGASLLSKGTNSFNEGTKSKIYKYSELILSLKTKLSEQNLNMIKSSQGSNMIKRSTLTKEYGDVTLKNTSNFISGHETYYFSSVSYLVGEIYRQNSSTFSLKNILTSLKMALSKEYHQEFKKVVNISIELFGWEQVPDQLTQ